MKLFLTNVTLFLLPICVVSLPLDHFLSGQLKKITGINYAVGEYATWNNLFEGAVHDDIVIYGSSRAWVNFDPCLIENRLNVSAFNLGIDGHGFELQYLRHKVLLEYNSIPKYIILSLDVFTLEGGNELYNAEQFLPYMFFNHLIRERTKTYQGYSFWDYHLPLLRFFKYRRAKLIIIKNILLSSRDNGLARQKGYLGMEKQWNDDLQKAKAKIQYYKIKLDKTLVDLFENFLIECEQKNIAVIFVYSPEYIDGQRFVKNREEILSLYRHFSGKYSIPLLDYSNDSMCKKKDYFYNAIHLNKRGATLFTKLLIEDLKLYICNP